MLYEGETKTMLLLFKLVLYFLIVGGLILMVFSLISANYRPLSPKDTILGNQNVGI